jgi:hypothetical protein
MIMTISHQMERGGLRVWQTANNSRTFLPPIPNSSDFWKSLAENQSAKKSYESRESALHSATRPSVQSTSPKTA